MPEQPGPRQSQHEIYVPEAMTEKPPLEDTEINLWLTHYGLRLDDEGYIHHNQPYPPLRDTVPEFTITVPTIPLFEPKDKEWLLKLITEEFSAQANKAQIMEVVDRIFASITGSKTDDFAHIIIMSNEHFSLFKKKIYGESPKGDADGINFGGLVIVRDTGGNNIFPLLFHELGHSFYPQSDNDYEDELRGYFFQELCYRQLQHELEQIGIKLGPMQQRPISEAHRQGLADAVKLISLLEPGAEERWKDTKYYDLYKEELARLLKIVSQAKEPSQL